ncbi:hypothetical protein BDR22DRAFT_843976 [Usnea florida]
MLKTYYILLSFLASFSVTASPLENSAREVADMIVPPPKPSKAPDPPAAPTPLPLSPDGVLPDGSVINYTPNNPSNRGHSCWTPPLSRPPPSNTWVKGTCTVCVVQRSNTDSGADYLLWARDNDNNAMGNMDSTTIYPIDAMVPGGNNQSIIPVGGSPLTLSVMLGTVPPNREMFLSWAGPGMPSTSFDTSPPAGGSDCNAAGTATNGAVTYVEWFIDC